MTPEKLAAIRQAYRTVFATPEGRIVLTDLMTAHYMQSNLPMDTVNNMIFAEGQRNVVLRILTIIGITPTLGEDNG
jgi:hypothetical protein